MIDAIFAQVSISPDPSAQFLKDWIGVALYILGVATAVLGLMVLWKQWKEKPAEAPAPAEPIAQPFVVKPHVEFTPKKDHDALVLQIKESTEETNRRFIGMAGASSESREKIYNMIRAQSEALGEKIDAVNDMSIRTSEKTDLTNAQVNRLDTKIDRVLENQANRNRPQ